MAGGTIELELIGPQRPPFNRGVTEVEVPGAGGVFTVLPGHTPLLSRLGRGVLVAYDGESSARLFAIHGGYVEVLDNKVVILADGLEPREDIDRKRAEAAAQRARGRIEKPEPDTDLIRAEAALQRALARLTALDHGESA